MLNEETFTYPCYPLIEAVAKTDAAFYYLSKDESTVGRQDYIEMPIINGINSEEEGQERIDFKRPNNVPPGKIQLEEQPNRK